MIRKLRVAEKVTAEATANIKELEDLRVNKNQSDKEIGELREYVDSASSFEEMVEEMSAKNLQLEDEVKTLAGANEELEEVSISESRRTSQKCQSTNPRCSSQALELATEMEEVQAEELKAAMLEQQSRQAMVQNLQEAIKMQRSRETEFGSTVEKYKSLVSNLKAEKEVLAASNSEALGGQGELVEKSRQALAKAAREAKVLEEAREMERSTKKLRMSHPVAEMQVRTLKALLPSEVAGLYTSALAGDATLQRVCGACAVGLEDLAKMWDATRDEEVRACESRSYTYSPPF